ncbi:hypothetical protein JCM11251_002893 [Rhodosporidiobolus azoricus]
MVYQQVGLLGQPRKPNLNPAPREQPSLYQPEDPTSRTGSYTDSARDKGKGRERSGNVKAAHNGQGQKKQQQHREAPQGNYKSYYVRRRSAFPVATTASSGSLDAPDPRLALLPANAFKGKKVLDVGCNSGLVTVEVAQRWGAAKVTGVDVDTELVRAAKGNADLAWSRQAPLPRLTSEATYLTSSSRTSRHPSAHSHTRSRSASPTRSRSRASSPVEPPSALPTAHDSSSPFLPPTLSYFPLALPRQYGYLPSPRSLLTRYIDQPEVETVGVLRRGKRKVMPFEEKAFPENVRFRCADWVEEKVPEDEEGYDVILAFSITKWIHLTSLNPGLLTFFRKCFTSLLPGGRLILEPQPFSSYHKTVRNLRHSSSSSSAEVAELQANLARLEEGAEKGWRAEEGDFERVLLELVGFERVEKLGYTGEEGTGWRRPVEMYIKRGGGSWGV